MAKVDQHELYPLFYALHLHHTGTTPIAGVSLQGELLEAVERFARKHSGTVVRPESLLTIDRIRDLVKHAKHDNDVRILLCEDGPDAKRPKTQDELREEDLERENELGRLVRRFWISATYGIIALMGAIAFRGWLRNRRWEDHEAATEATLSAVDAPQVDPLLLIFMALVAVSVWGLVDAFTIAKDNWLDFDRAREAVPLVGHRWIARVRRKRRERSEKQQKK